MAQLTDLKKRLRGIEVTRQLTGAMKTVSSAKYGRLVKRAAAAHRYAEEAEQLRLQVGQRAETPVTASQRVCCLVLGHNRGLCGSYNSTLHAFAQESLQAWPEVTLLVAGKAAAAYFSARAFPMEKTFALPDVPDFTDCRPILEDLLRRYQSGEAGEVWLIRQSSVNSLTQLPVRERLLPFDLPDAGGGIPLCFPNQAAVWDSLWRIAVGSAFYHAVLDGAQAAQAATLSAMRTAYDNASETAKRLSLEIQKLRQSAVTSGVLETASGALAELGQSGR